MAASIAPHAIRDAAQCKVSYSFASGGDKAQIEAKMNEAYTAVFNALGSQFKYAEIAA